MNISILPGSDVASVRSAIMSSLSQSDLVASPGLGGVERGVDPNQTVVPAVFGMHFRDTNTDRDLVHLRNLMLGDERPKFFRQRTRDGG